MGKYDTTKQWAAAKLPLEAGHEIGAGCDRVAQGPSDATACSAVLLRIKAYLTTGGAFNPELADHIAVRNLLIDCRDVLLDLQKTSSNKCTAPSLPLAPNCRL